MRWEPSSSRLVTGVGWDSLPFPSGDYRRQKANRRTKRDRRRKKRGSGFGEKKKSNEEGQMNRKVFMKREIRGGIDSERKGQQYGEGEVG